MAANSDPFKAHLLSVLTLSPGGPQPTYTGPRDAETDAILKRVAELVPLEKAERAREVRNKPRR